MRSVQCYEKCLLSNATSNQFRDLFLETEVCKRSGRWMKIRAVILKIWEFLDDGNDNESESIKPKLK